MGCYIKHGVVALGVDYLHHSVVVRPGILASPLVCTPRPSNVISGLPTWVVAYTLLCLRRPLNTCIDHELFIILSHRHAWTAKIAHGLQKTFKRHQVLPALIDFVLHNDQSTLGVSYPITFCLQNGHPTSSLAFSRCLWPKYNNQLMADVVFPYRLLPRQNGQPMSDMAYLHHLLPAHKGQPTSHLRCTYHSWPAHTD